MSETPNWEPKLREAAEEHGIELTEAVTLADIRHDDWCARIQGTGVCDCDPNVRLISRKIDGGGSR